MLSHTWPIINELAEVVYDAYEATQAGGGMAIRKLKRVGDQICLWDGIWQEHNILGRLEDIRHDVRYSFESAAPGGDSLWVQPIRWQWMTKGKTFSN